MTRNLSLPCLLPLLLVPIATAAAQTPPAKPTAVERLRGADPMVRKQAFAEVQRQGAANVPALVEWLRECTKDRRRDRADRRIVWSGRSDVLYRRLPVYALAACEPNTTFLMEVAPSVPLGSAHRDWLLQRFGAMEQQILAFHLLETAGGAAAPAVPVAIDLLSTKECDGRAAALLLAIGEPAIEPLRQALADRQRSVTAACVLAAIGAEKSNAAKVQAVLLAELAADRRTTRDKCVLALGRIASGDKTVVAALAALVEGRPGELTRLAAWALGRQRAAAFPVLQRLLTTAETGRVAHTLAAVRAQGAASGPLAARVLALATKASRDIDITLIESLAVVAPGTEHEAAAVDWIIEKSTESVVEARAAALNSLGSFPRQLKARQRLEAALDEDTFPLLVTAVQALSRFEGIGGDATAKLWEVVDGKRGVISLFTLAMWAQAGWFEFSAIEQGRLQVEDVLDELRGEALAVLARQGDEQVQRVLRFCGDERLGWLAHDAVVGAGERAVPLLNRLMSDGELGQHAASALAWLGDAGYEHLLAAIMGSDAVVAERAQVALKNAVAEEGSGSPELQQRLIKMLRQGDGVARKFASELLSWMSLDELTRRDVEVMLDLIKHSEGAMRRHLVQAIADREGDRVRSMLLQCLADEDSEVRLAAVHGLHYYHDVGRDEVRRALLDRLGDELPSVRVAAVQALGGDEGRKPQVFAALQKVVSADGSFDVQAAALMALGGFGDRRDDVLPLLRKHLDDRHPGLRVGAMRGLAALGTIEGPDFDKVVQALRASDVALRSAAATAVARVRPDLQAGLNNLYRLERNDQRYGGRGVGDPQKVAPAMIERVRTVLGVPEARRVLAALDKVLEAPKAYAELAPLVSALFARPEPEVRAKAINAYGRMLEPAQSMQQIVPMVRDPHADVRVAAVGSLHRGSGMDADVERALREAGRDPVPAVRSAAVRALGWAVRYEGWEPFLLTGLRDADAGVRLAALREAARWQAGSPELVTLIGGQLGAPDGPTVDAAIDALGRQGPAANGYVEALLELRKSAAVARMCKLNSALVAMDPERTDVILALVEALGSSEDRIRTSAEFLWEHSLLR